MRLQIFGVVKGSLRKKSTEVSDSPGFNGVSVPLWTHASIKPLRSSSIVTQIYQNCCESKRSVSGLFSKADRVNTAKTLPNNFCVFSFCVFSCWCWGRVAPPPPPPPWYILAFQLLFDLFQSWLEIIPYRTSRWDGFSSASCSISPEPLFFCPPPLDQLLLLNDCCRNLN